MCLNSAVGVGEGLTGEVALLWVLVQQEWVRKEGREGGWMRSCLGFPAPSSRCRPTQMVNKRWCFYQNIPSPFRRRECGGFLSVLKNHGSLFWETLLSSLPNIHFPFLLYPQNPNFVHDSIVVAENLDFLVARGGHMTRPDQ